MVDHYYNIFIYLMIIQSSNHIYLQSFLAARNALLGDEERVEAAKAGGVSTPPFNSTKTSILSPTLIAACVSSRYVWFDSTSHLCTYFLHALLLVKTPFSPPIFNHQTAPKEKALFVGPIPWKLSRPPFSDCSCCSIICKRDWRGGETRRRDETTRRPAARWTVKTLEAKEWKPQGFQLRNYKVKVTWWRTTQFFFLQHISFKTKEIYNFKCWVNLETFFETCWFDLWTSLIGFNRLLYISQQLHQWNPSNRPPVEHHCVHWWLLLLERQGLVQFPS